MSTLFWGERGHIACEKHAPYRGSDTWVWERWSRMPKPAQAEFQALTGKPAICETCASHTKRPNAEQV